MFYARAEICVVVRGRIRGMPDILGVRKFKFFFREKLRVFVGPPELVPSQAFRVFSTFFLGALELIFEGFFMHFEFVPSQQKKTLKNGPPVSWPKVKTLSSV